MAKIKAKKQPKHQFLSPKKYVREKMRSLEIGDCYMNDDIWDTGLGHVLVSRMTCDPYRRVQEDM